jgi:hypothetical protein
MTRGAVGWNEGRVGVATFKMDPPLDRISVIDTNLEPGGSNREVRFE